MNINKIYQLEKKRMQYLKKWNLPMLDQVEAELRKLKQEDTNEINAIIANLKKNQHELR